MRVIILSILMLAVCTTANAGNTINCGKVAIDSVYVQGDRGDGSFHANKMLVIMGEGKLSACSDFTFAYLENTDDAYDGTLSMAISAYMAGKPLRIQVEEMPPEGDAKRIAWVNF